MQRTVSVEATQVNKPRSARDIRGGGGLRLHVREWGDPEAPPIVFVHGWSQSQLCWSRQIAGALGEDFRIVTFDLRGHGMSEKPLDAEHYLDARLWADDLAAVIEEVAPDRPVLVAWSYGGYVVADYLRAYGEERIAGVNLVGAAVMREPSVNHIGPGFLDNAPDACVPDLLTNIDGIRRFLRACTVRPLGDEDWSAALCWNMAVPAEVRGALLAREIGADVALARVSLPVLVTHGRDDAIVLPAMAEHVLGACGTARASWYEGVGHMPFVEDGARFDRELREFAQAS